jgi:hypothetical protein
MPWCINVPVMLLVEQPRMRDDEDGSSQNAGTSLRAAGPSIARQLTNRQNPDPPGPQ